MLLATLRRPASLNTEEGEPLSVNHCTYVITWFKRLMMNARSQRHLPEQRTIEALRAPVPVSHGVQEQAGFFLTN